MAIREKKKLRIRKSAIKKSIIKGKTPNNIKLTLIFIIAILFTITVVELVYFFYKIAYVKVYDAFVIVDNKVGINIDVDNKTINFGIAPPAGSIKRDLVVVNTGEEPLGVNVISTGSISKFFYTEEPSFILDIGETKNIDLITKFPKETKLGNYTGKIILIFTRI